MRVGLSLSGAWTEANEPPQFRYFRTLSAGPSKDQPSGLLVCLCLVAFSRQQTYSDGLPCGGLVLFISLDRSRQQSEYLLSGYISVVRLYQTRKKETILLKKTRFLT